MSNYTTQVRWICESKSGFTPEQLMNKTPDEIIDAARPSVFNFNYPIYDQAYKPVLESLILNHFYVREIGQETVGLHHIKINHKGIAGIGGCALVGGLGIAGRAHGQHLPDIHAGSLHKINKIFIFFKKL